MTSLFLTSRSHSVSGFSKSTSAAVKPTLAAKPLPRPDSASKAVSSQSSKPANYGLSSKPGRMSDGISRND